MKEMVSFIICTYNRCEYIYETLRRLAVSIDDKNGCEILLIDNNSKDDTQSECKRFMADYPSADFHYLVEEKQGLSFARNRGVAESKGDFLVFLDDDAFVEKNYVDNLLQQLSIYPDAMAFGGKVIPLYESGVTPEWMSKWSRSWVSAIDLGENTKLFDGNSFPIGANMGVHRRCFESCGTFETSLGRSKRNLIGGEEKELFLRLKRNEFRIYYFPNVEVQHVIPESRTTREYIVRFAEGVGLSEKIRTKGNSFMLYLKRLSQEFVKWMATLLLWFCFLVRRQTPKGNALVLFRWHVSHGLLFGDADSAKG